MKERNLTDSHSKRIPKKASGWSNKSVRRVSYFATFVVVLSLVATSYVTADSGTQVSLPGVSARDNLEVNPLQGQKIDQLDTVHAMAVTLSDNSGGKVSGRVADVPAATSAVATTGDIKAANVASTIASEVGLSSSNSVSSGAESINLSAQLAQADASSVSKQQLVDPTVVTDLLGKYTVKEGDSIDSIAEKFSITPQTIRWANGLRDNAVSPGATLVMPAVDGVVYKVQDGDKLADIANKYHSNVDAITDVNNLTGQNLSPGQVLLLPDGILPEEPVRANHFRFNITRNNNYAYGYCTWYAYNKRVEMGLPVYGGWGNAKDWANGAKHSGLLVDGTPSAGAIFQTRAGYYGHVGIVEAVNPDGSIWVSEMNYRGWNVKSHRVITNLSGYSFIH